MTDDELRDALTSERLEMGGFCDGSCGGDIMEKCTPCLLKAAHDQLAAKDAEIKALKTCLKDHCIPEHLWHD